MDNKLRFGFMAILITWIVALNTFNKQNGQREIASTKGILSKCFSSLHNISKRTLSKAKQQTQFINHQFGLVNTKMKKAWLDVVGVHLHNNKKLKEKYSDLLTKIFKKYPEILEGESPNDFLAKYNQKYHLRLYTDENGLVKSGVRPVFKGDLKQTLRSKGYKESAAKNISEMAEKIEWDQRETVLFLRYGRPKKNFDSKKLERFIIYTRSLNEKDKLIAFQNINEIWQKQQKFKDHKLIKKFNSYQKKTKNFALKHSSPEVVDAYFKRLSTCRGGIMSAESVKTANKIGTIFAGIDIATILATYGWLNRDNGISGELIGKASFEVITYGIYSFFAAKMMVDPTAGFLKKASDQIWLNIGVDAFTTSAYSLIWGTSEEEAKIKVEQLKKDPHFRKQMEALFSYLEKPEVLEQLEKKFSEILYRTEYIEIDGETQQVQRRVEAEDLTQEELNSAGMDEFLLSLITLSEYYQNTPEGESYFGFLPTNYGDRGLDLFVYKRYYNIHPIRGVWRQVLLATFLNRLLCMNPNSKLAGLKWAPLAATIIFSINNAIFAPDYFKTRTQKTGIR